MQKSKIGETIRQIISMDPNIFSDPKRFVTLIDDLAPDLVKERKIFRRVIDEEILRDFGDIWHKNVNTVDFEIKKIKNKLLENYGVSDTWCDIIIEGFIYAFRIQQDAKSALENTTKIVDYKNNDKIVEIAGTERDEEPLDKNSRKNWMDDLIDRNYEEFLRYIQHIHSYDRDFAERLLMQYFKFAERGAVIGIPLEEYRIGIHYLYGLGCKKNTLKAKRWLKKASKNGSREAARKLKEL